MKTAKYSESTLLILVGSLLLTLLVAPLAKAGDVDFKWLIPLLESAEHIPLGDSASAISGKLEPTWIPINTNIFLRDHPFNLWVPYTNLATVLEWESKEDGRDGWPCIVFAVFSDAQKTNLVDALLHDGDPGVRPLVDGIYNHNLTAIRKGDSMQKVFATLGRETCDYYQNKDGEWRIKVYYSGIQGAFEIEADAGAGIVLRVTKLGRL